MKIRRGQGRFVDSEGYVMVYAPEHPSAQARGYVRENRLVMERYLGRILSKQEVVHHIDGNKTNNRLENLEIMQWPKHTAHHTTGKPCSDSARAMLRARNTDPENQIKKKHRERVMASGIEKMHPSVRRLWGNAQVHNLSMRNISSLIGVTHGAVELWFGGSVPRPRNEAKILAACQQIEIKSALAYKQSSGNEGSGG